MSLPIGQEQVSWMAVSLIFTLQFHGIGSSQWRPRPRGVRTRSGDARGLETRGGHFRRTNDLSPPSKAALARSPQHNGPWLTALWWLSDFSHSCRGWRNRRGRWYRQLAPNPAGIRLRLGFHRGCPLVNLMTTLMTRGLFGRQAAWG